MAAPPGQRSIRSSSILQARRLFSRSPSISHDPATVLLASDWRSTAGSSGGLSRFEAYARSEEHTSELQSHRDLHSFPTRRSSDLAFAIDQPRPGDRAPGLGLEVNGWVIGRVEPVRGIRISSLGHQSAVHLLGVRRPDVATDYPDHLHADS